MRPLVWRKRLSRGSAIAKRRPARWDVSVTLDEVIAAGLRVTVDCQDCKTQTPIDPAFFAGRRRGSTTMQQLAEGVRCMACGSADVALKLAPKS
jgi:hypothetical protein